MTTGHYICSVRRKILKEDIIAVGMDLMFLHGYNATGIKDITDSVNIPKGSFYNHFKNKEQFAIEMIESYGFNGWEMHKSALLESKLSPVKRLKKFYQGLIKMYTNELDFKLGCILGNFSLEMSDVSENIRKTLNIELKKCESVIVQCLNEAKALGEIDQSLNTKKTGAAILNSWHGTLLRMKSTADKKPLDDFMHLVFKVILKQ